MRALTFVEIDIDYCALTYGTAPCSAVLGTTGDAKCFNTRSTCQVPLDYDNAPVTLRFAIDTLALPESGIEALPFLTGVSYSPATISLGQDLGTRASVTASFADRPHADTGPGFDKYVADRAYDPFALGTFFGKFAMRQKYLKGRPMRLILGRLGQTLAQMETRHFVIEEFSGPDRQGNYTITAKDPLKLADGDRAQAPSLSPGYLSADISDADTTAYLLPSGIGDVAYPASGWISISGTEICEFTRSGDTLTLTRGQFNTDAVAHSAEDRVQLCLNYNGESPADAIYDLLTTYAGIPTSYITLTDWQDEVTSYYRRLITTLIAEPTSVKTLVSEIIEQVGLAVWWDDLGQKIRLQVLRDVPAGALLFDEGNMLEGSFSVKDQPEKRISQVWNYYGRINPLKSVDDVDNYRSTLATIDATAQTLYGSAAIKKIYSRWIPELGQTVASRVNNIQLGRFVNPPRRFAFSVFRAEGATLPVLGGGYRLTAQPLQDATGAQVIATAQVTRLTPYADRVDVELEENLFTIVDAEDLTERVLTVTATTPAVDMFEAHNQIYPPVGLGDTVTLIINSGVSLGVVLTGLYEYPGLFDGWPRKMILGAQLTAGSNIVTCPGGTDLSDVLVGMPVGALYAGQIPPQTTVTAVDDVAKTLTLSQNATGTTTYTYVFVYQVYLKIVHRGKIHGYGGDGGRGANFEGVAGSGEKNGTDGGTGFLAFVPVDVEFGPGAFIAGGGGGGAGSGCQNWDDHRGGSGGGGQGYPWGAGGPKNGAGEAGFPGSLTAPGIGGRAYTSTALFGIGGPKLLNKRGGTGGGLGTAGAQADNNSTFTVTRGSPGAAGDAVYGISFVNVTAGTPTYYGATTG